MRRALVVNLYWDTFGGGERYTAAFIRYLLDRGWSVDIVWHQNFSSQIKLHFGIDISLANFIPNYPLSAIRYPLLFWLSDGSLPTSFAPKTLIHFQFPFTNIHGKSLPNLIKSRLYKFIVNSEFTKSFIDKEFLVDSHVIYPPVPLLSPLKKEKVILYVGRFSSLTQLKNPHLLIQAFKNISKKMPGWKLILAGGVGVGTYPGAYDDLQKSAAGFPITFVANPGIEVLQKIYGSARIFWSASGLGVDENLEPLKVEHFGISVVEAMSAGAVPIISNLGGYKEIVNSNKDGYLYENLSDLEKITLQLIKNQSRLGILSQNAIAKSKMFDTARFYAALDKLI